LILDNIYISSSPGDKTPGIFFRPYGLVITKISGVLKIKGEVMAYKKLFYHIVWSTKHREPIITSISEEKLDCFLLRRVMNHPAILNALRA